MQHLNAMKMEQMAVLFVSKLYQHSIHKSSILQLKKNNKKI